MPVAKALLSGSLPIESYLALIESFYLAHEALEDEVAASAEPRVRAVWRDGMRKLSRLESDRDELRKRASSSRPSLEALVFADEIRSRAASDPIALLGFLYVFEGATLGAAVIRPAVASAFELDEAGLLYLSSYGARSHENWLQFKDRLDETFLEDEEQEIVLDAARASFEHLRLVLRELEPARDLEPTRDRVRTLNPAAGSHPIASDPRELRAATLAGAATWKWFPYLHPRFGERGRAFTRSDSAWIVYLLESSEETLKEQLDWLAALLSPRGMPRFVLEVHLGHLESSLRNALPEREERYRPLGRARERLARDRRAVLPEERFQDLSARFDARVGPEWTGRLPRTGSVLVSAVVDEHALSPRAVASLDWLLSPERFTTRWIEAVTETIGEARRALASR